MLKDLRVCEYLFTFFVSTYNKAANMGERQFYPYADSMKATNQTTCFVNKQILNLNPLEVHASIGK